MGQGGDGVAVAHPYLGACGDTFEEGADSDAFEDCAAIFARGRGLYLTSEGGGHELCAVAYAEDGDCGVECLEVDMKSIVAVNGQGTARQDDAYNAFGLFVAGHILVVGDYLTVNIKLADSATDQLSGLRPEVEDNDFLHA